MMTLRRRLRERREDGEGGFTLIELMVVVLIIGILLAIAIPLFLSARGGAQNRATESNLRNALTNSKAFWTQGQTYSGVAAALPNAEPSLAFVTATAPAANTNQVGVAVPADNNAVVLTAASPNGPTNKPTCFYLLDVEPGSSYIAGSITVAGTWYGTVAGACPVPTNTLPAAWGTIGSTTTGAGW